MTTPAGGPRVLVLTIVHVPRDARIFERQLRALRDAGVDVTYAAPWSACGETPPADLDTLDVPRSVGRDRLASLAAARRLLRDHAAAYDLVLLHDPELLLVCGAATRRTAVVWDVHEDAGQSLVARPWVPAWLRPAARFVVRVVERLAERRVHLLLAEHSYQDRFRRQHPVVPNGPQVPAVAPPSGRDRVVYVGRVAAARGAHELVALGRRLRDRVEVHVIGDAEGDVAPVLTAAAERGDVVWHGFVPNTEALGLVTGATAGLSLLHDLPNFRGSMPTKVLEYLGCGVPVITTPLPLAVEVVRTADAGEVVPFADVDAVVAAVERLVGDDDARQAAADRGRRYVLEEHAWQAHAPAFVEQLRAWARAG